MRIDLPRFGFDRRFAFLTAALVLAVGLAIGISNELVYSGQKLRDLDIQARTLGQSVAASLMFSDPSTARENAIALAENPEIDAVGIYGSSGALIASFARPGSDAPPPTTTLHGSQFNGAFVEVARPVTVDRQTYGAVYIRARRDTWFVRLARYMPIGLLILMTALVLFCGRRGAGRTRARLRRTRGAGGRSCRG